MKDQMELSELTNSFIYSHRRELFIIAAVFLVSVCTLHFVSFYNFVVMIAAIVATAYFAWVMGHMNGINLGIQATLDTLIELKLFETEISDEGTMVKKVEDLVYFDKCQKCEDGMILNPSATKGQKYNGEEEEKV